MLVPIIDMNQQVEKLGSVATTPDDIQREVKQFKDAPLSAIKALSGAAVKLAKHIDEALKREDRDFLTKAQASKGKNKLPQELPGNKIFHLDFALSSRHAEILRVDADKRFGLHELSTPFIIENSDAVKVLFKNGHARLNHLVFRASFEKDRAPAVHSEFAWRGRCPASLARQHLREDRHLGVCGRDGRAE